MAEAATVHVVVVAAVTDSQRGLLLVRKRDDGLWGCPKGWLQPGETLRDAVKRKVSEETGVLVSTEKILSISSHLTSESPTPEGDLRIIVLCHPLAGQPRPGENELEVTFHSLDGLPELRDDQGEWIPAAVGGQAELLE